MTHRFDPLVTVRESRRAAYTTGRKIGSGVPEGQGAARPRCGAVAGDIGAWAHDLSVQVSTVATGFIGVLVMQ
jgi:hypothetical protein